MEAARTTEELLSNLAPEAREEVLRLAARLQARSDADSADGTRLLIAAREAGIEDRHLREAVASLAPSSASKSRTEPRGFVVPMVVPVLLLLLIAQACAAWRAAYSDAGAVSFALAATAALVPFALPALRRKWNAPALVAATWLVYLGADHIRMWGPHLPKILRSDQAAGFALAAVAIVAAALGAIVSARLSRDEG